MKMGYIFNQAIPMNLGRYQILEGKGSCNILLIYKKEMFLKFGTMFRHEGKTGLGESINRQHIKKAFIRDCKLIARIDKDGNLLLASLSEFRESGVKWTNKEGIEVISNSIHLFKNYNSLDSAYNDMIREDSTLRDWQTS